VSWFFRKNSSKDSKALPPMSLPLDKIQKVDEAGILFLDNEGNPYSIDYTDAYTGWNKKKCIRKSKAKYICDRTKSEEWTLTFYTNPQSHFLQTRIKKHCGLIS